MRATATLSLGRHVQAFFADYLTCQRGLSPHTVLLTLIKN